MSVTAVNWRNPNGCALARKSRRWENIAFATVGPLGMASLHWGIAEIDGDIAAYRGLKTVKRP
jgi:hypothetical protein